MAAKYHRKYRKVVKEANDLLVNPGQSELSDSIAVAIGCDVGSASDQLDDDSPQITPDSFDNFTLGFDSDILPFSSSDEDNVEEPTDLQHELASWVVQSQVTRLRCNELLSILRKHGCQLPRDSRTLLRTPRYVHVDSKCGGQFAYFGLHKALEQATLNESVHLVLNLQVNIDGVPLHKSSTAQFWPIICSVNGGTPMMAALYFGHSKPKSMEDFTEQFVAEVESLQSEGFSFNEYNSYKAALDASKLAEQTSNIETCEDDVDNDSRPKKKRANKKPAKLQVEDSDTDAGPSNELSPFPSPPKKKTRFSVLSDVQQITAGDKSSEDDSSTSSVKSLICPLPLLPKTMTQDNNSRTSERSESVRSSVPDTGSERAGSVNASALNTVSVKSTVTRTEQDASNVVRPLVESRSKVPSSVKTPISSSSQSGSTRKPLQQKNEYATHKTTKLHHRHRVASELTKTQDMSAISNKYGSNEQSTTISNTHTLCKTMTLGNTSRSSKESLSVKSAVLNTRREGAGLVKASVFNTSRVEGTATRTKQGASETVLRLAKSKSPSSAKFPISSSSQSKSTERPVTPKAGSSSVRTPASSSSQSNSTGDALKNSTPKTTNLQHESARMETSGSAGTSSLNSVLQRIARELVQLRADVRDLRSLIEDQPLPSSNSSASQQEVALVVNGPVSSIADYDELVSCLADPSQRNYVLKVLRRIGGTDFKDAVRSAMRRLLDNYVMSFMSMDGRSLGKRNFRDTPVCQIVVDAVLLNYPSSTISEIHHVMGTYLKAAPHREGGAGSGARLECTSLEFCSGSEQPDSQSPTYDLEFDTQSPLPDEETDVEV